MDKLLTGLAATIFGAIALICNPFLMIISVLIDYRITLVQIMVAVCCVALSAIVGAVGAALTKLKGA